MKSDQVFLPLGVSGVQGVQPTPFQLQRAAGQHHKGGGTDWSCDGQEGNVGYEGKGCEVHCC